MPASLRDAGDEELRACLERALSEVAGRPQRVAGLSRRAFAYETSFAIDELEVELAGGEQLGLLVKDVGPTGLSAPAAAAKPDFTLDPRREIAVYRSLLDRSGVSAPRYYGAGEDSASGRAWLFIERVEGEVLADVGEPEAWQAAAAWAGGLDRALAIEDPDLEAHLLQRDREWHSQWIGRAIFASSTRGDGDLKRRLAPVAPTLLDRLEALPRGFVHGELYASNVVVERQEGGVRIAPVDWELAGIGPFALDLAALLSGWGDDERSAMCEAFHRSLPPERRAAVSREILLDAANLCELALALQWIGWSQQWLPPAEHHRNWTAEALRLLEETGL